MSHLTAAEALDSGEIPSLSKGLTISLIGGKRWTWRPRRLIQSTSNRSYLIPHPPSQGKHLGQRRRHVWLRNTWSRPLGTIHHGEHLLGTLVLFHRKGLLSRSVYVAGRTEAGTPQSMFGVTCPSGYESQPINTSSAPDLTVPVQTVH